MRRRKLMQAALALSIVGSGVSARADQAPANPASGPKTQALLNLLASLKERGSTRVVTGQFVSAANARPETGITTVQQAWDTYVEDLAQQTGQYPALVGFDMIDRQYQGGTSAQNVPSIEPFKSLSQAHEAQGGMITLMWHAPNPWTLSHSWSDIPQGRSMSELTTAGTAANIQYMAWLTKVGDNLAWYKAQRIPVIWRPTQTAQR